MYSSATLIAFLLLAGASFGQLPATSTPKPPATAKVANEDPFGRDSPHGCVVGFLRSAQHEDYAKAAQYLDVQETPSQAQELARELQVVLNYGLTGNLDRLSRSPEGDLRDSLPRDRELVGFVETKSGRLNILLDRVQRNTGPPIWLFSSDTLRDIPRAFGQISPSGIERFVPPVLSRVKVFSLPLWRWFGIILIVVLALIVASLVTRALIPLLRSLLRRMTGQENDRRLLLLRRPMRLIFLAVAIRGLASFAVSALARTLWINVAEVLAVVGCTWLLIQFSDVVSNFRSRQLLRRQVTAQLAVLALMRRLSKLLVTVLAVILLLHEAGINVSAMLAGLGIGGIALALAAQKTLEDFFGGITVISREAIRVGDFCKLADLIGTIEDIGLGSTCMRTLERTRVSIPNSKLSQMNIENYSVRDKIWFHHVFGLRSDTSPGQMRQVLSQVTHLLREDERVEEESARIRLIQFAASSLQVEIFAYIKVTDYTAFVEIQEDLLLKIMDLITASGTSIAMPSQVSHLDSNTWSRVAQNQIPETTVPKGSEKG